MKSGIVAAGSLVLALCLGGCVLPSHISVHGPSPVVVPGGHVHTDHCGHYRRHGRWYHDRGHSHGHGCGHHFVGGIWVFD